MRIGDQAEKFLFYRGVARVALPVSAVVSPDGTAAVKNTDSAPLGTIVRFDRRHRKLCYEIKDTKDSRATLATPALTGDLDTLAKRLETILIR